MKDKKPFSYTLEAVDKKTKARAGVIKTPHGEIPTPRFMPVGTHGAVKAMAPKDLHDHNIPIILSNTYHLEVTPGSKLVSKAGGLHKYMNWNKPILTDSGGFQVFSLKDKIFSEEGVTFNRPDGHQLVFTPEFSIGVQQRLGADIIMAFDECIPYPADKKYVAKSIARTHRWLDRCIAAWTNREKQALFGIIQGSTYMDMRKKCVEEVCARDLPGYAIGGVSVGEGFENMKSIVDFVAPIMPADKPRYVMGVGLPEDLLAIWEQGIDISDCIIPTKYARSGTLFTFKGKLRIRKQQYRRDFFPIEPNCHCYTCTNFTRSYVKHLFDSDEILGTILASIHNVAFYNTMSDQARQAILEGRFLEYKKNFLEHYNTN